ncbi:MAG: hypothetical protein FWE09_08750, partial [Treponema sp.]|nr:hypothetical protein [Treponema sp.]
MRNMAIAVALALALAACNNFYHDLIPPDEAMIVSFGIDGQLGQAEIAKHGFVKVLVAEGTDLSGIVPRIAVSPGATIFPITFPYVQAAFPGADLIEDIFSLLNAGSGLAQRAYDLIRRTEGFRAPQLDIPIDFSAPVSFFVLSAQGSTREWTVTVETVVEEPLLRALRLAKRDNPVLLIDAVGHVSGDGVAMTAQLPAGYGGQELELAPSFSIYGEKLWIEGEEISGGRRIIRLNAALGIPQQRRLVVTWWDGREKEYLLSIVFRGEPGGEAAITDFRFDSADNPGIAATSVAQIAEGGDSGTIRARVFYSGARPETLVPRFLSQGTVRAAGAVQRSGQSGHDFSEGMEYRVASFNGLYYRSYAVIVELVDVTGEMPRMLSFGLELAHNPGITRPAAGLVGGGSIVIDAHYGGTVEPRDLMPSFSAVGIVVVLGSEQTSGASPQDLSRGVIYV